MMQGGIAERRDSRTIGEVGPKCICLSEMVPLDSIVQPWPEFNSHGRARERDGVKSDHITGIKQSH